MAFKDFYRDNNIIAVAISPLDTIFDFGFSVNEIIIKNDGTVNLEFSFDDFANIHGVVRKGETLSMSRRFRNTIHLRGILSAPTYRFYAWG